MKNNRKRIHCYIDHKESVVYGTVRHERSPYTDETIVVITDENYPDNPFRIMIDDVMEISDTPASVT